MRNNKPFFIVFFRAFTNFIFTIVELLLLLRIIVVFFNANRTNELVRWIIDSSNPLVAPFKDIFGSFTLFDTFTIEIDALIAWFVYLVIYVLIVEFIKFTNTLIINSRMP